MLVTKVTDEGSNNIGRVNDTVAEGVLLCGAYAFTFKVVDCAKDAAAGCVMFVSNTTVVEKEFPIFPEIMLAVVVSDAGDVLFV